MLRKLQRNFSLPINKNFLVCCTSTDSSITQCRDSGNDHDSSLSLRLPSNLGFLANQFNNATPENSYHPDKISSSKYYDVKEIQNFEIPHKSESLLLFHIKVCSLDKILMTFNISWKNFTKWRNDSLTNTRVLSQEYL